MVGPISEWRMQHKEQLRRERFLTCVAWTVGIAVALLYWGALSAIFRWEQLGEAIGVFTVVPVGMIAGNLARSRLESSHKHLA